MTQGNSSSSSSLGGLSSMLDSGSNSNSSSDKKVEFSKEPEITEFIPFPYMISPFMEGPETGDKFPEELPATEETKKQLGSTGVSVTLPITPTSMGKSGTEEVEKKVKEFTDLISPPYLEYQQIFGGLKISGP